jgi:choice-of-anchor A domain-containing protein
VAPELGLGAAAGCTVLELSTAKVSITGPAGGIFGDICIAPGGSLAMSGDEFVTGTVNLGAGAKFSNSSHGTVTVAQNVDLSAAISAAYKAADDAANQACDPALTFDKLDGKTVTTITGDIGINVICVGDVVLSGKQITLTGPVGAQFIINVTGKFVLTGGGDGPQIRVAGGVQPKDVLYNIIGTGADVAFSGGGGGVNCCAAIVDGTLLAPDRKINLSPGLVNGQVISGKDINIVSGASVFCPCPPPKK